MKSNLLAEATGSLEKHPDFPGLAESLFSLIHYRSSVQKKCARLGEMECRLLSLLAEELEAVRMNELAERLGVSESRITRLVERMVKKGLVTKHRSTRDRRSWEVGISRQGIDANVNVSAVSSEVQAELMARLPEAEHELIYHNVKTYIETFHQVLENKDTELESSHDRLT